MQLPISLLRSGLQGAKETLSGIDIAIYGHTTQALPFLLPVSDRRYAECPGCEQHCMMPVINQSERCYIVCDKPEDYGRIALTQADMQRWKLSAKLLAEWLSSQLPTPSYQIVQEGAVYRLGLIESHSVYLSAVQTIPEGHQGLFKRNDVLVVTLEPSAQDSLSCPAIGLQEILTFLDGKWHLDMPMLFHAAGQNQDDHANLFCHKGATWDIRYNGHFASVKDTKGMHHLQHLLSHAGEEVLAMRLLHLDMSEAEFQSYAKTQLESDNLYADNMENQPLLDEQACREVRHKIASLEKSDPHSPEIKRLTDYLNAATYQGRSKHFNNTAKRTRQAVQRAVKTAIGNIQSAGHISLASHLRNALETGAFCSYRPEPPIIWRI